MAGASKNGDEAVGSPDGTPPARHAGASAKSQMLASARTIGADTRP
jgi:hypothetical protein